MAKTTLTGVYYYGNKASDYGIENNCLDFATFCKAFDGVMCSDIISRTSALGMCWELENGEDYDEENNTYAEVFQYMIVSDSGARIIMEDTDYLLWYCEDLDMYVMGIEHYGTSWDYVLTNINLNDKSSYDNY